MLYSVAYGGVVGVGVAGEVLQRFGVVRRGVQDRFTVEASAVSALAVAWPAAHGERPAACQLGDLRLGGGDVDRCVDCGGAGSRTSRMAVR